MHIISNIVWYDTCLITDSQLQLEYMVENKGNVLADNTVLKFYVAIYIGTFGIKSY